MSAPSAGATLPTDWARIEHVIGYWLLWEQTHSPCWLGYVVIAMSQMLVQHLAPDDTRGRVMGTYGMLVHGSRVCSGVLRGAAGAALGAHLGLAVLAALVLVR